jgi:hypothetical protein
MNTLSFETSKDWATLLPEKMPFYHLGEIILQESSSQAAWLWLDDEGSSFIGYQILGEVRGALVLAFPKVLAPQVPWTKDASSVYSELGNLLASKISTELSRHGAKDTMISPPIPLTKEMTSTLLKRAGLENSVQRRYLHLKKEFIVPVEVLLLPRASHLNENLTSEELGNA